MLLIFRKIPPFDLVYEKIPLRDIHGEVCNLIEGERKIPSQAGGEVTFAYERGVTKLGCVATKGEG